MTDGRTGAPRAGAGQRETLRAHPDLHRGIPAVESGGLPDDELRRAAPPPSALSLRMTRPATTCGAP